FGEGFLEGVEGAEGAVDGGGEFTGRGVGAAGGDDFPEERVVHVSAGVVADGGADVLGDAAEVFDEFVGAFRFEVRFAGDGVVQVGDVCLMMLRVMDFHRAGIDVGLKGVVCVAEIRESVCHGGQGVWFAYRGG